MHNGVVLNYELFILHAMIVMNLDYSKKYLFGNGMNSMYDNLDDWLDKCRISNFFGYRLLWWIRFSESI